MAAIRWLAPSTWVEEHSPGRLAVVADKRRVADVLQTTAAWFMIAATVPHVRAALDKAKLHVQETQQTRNEARAQLDLVQGWLDGEVESSVLRDVSFGVAAPGYAGLAAMSLVDAAGATLVQVVMRCSNAAHLARRARDWHHIAATMDETAMCKYMEARYAELATAIKRGIPYPHPADFGLVVAHGDGWVLYHFFHDIGYVRRHGQWGAQIMPQLLPPEQHGFLRTDDVRAAIDFLGHRSPDAMHEAFAQLRQDPQLRHVVD